MEGNIGAVGRDYGFLFGAGALREGPDGPIGEISINSPIGVPIFPLKTILPLAAFFLLLQGIAESIRCIICIRTGAWPPRLHDVEELEKELIEKHRLGVEMAKTGAQQEGAGKEAAI